MQEITAYGDRQLYLVRPLPVLLGSSGVADGHLSDDVLL
jgi:hypothetical protein